MKKILLSWAIFLLTCSAVSATSKTETQYLKSFAQVWGFLKYYHPEVAKGNPDWDQELLTMLPKVKAASTKDAFDLLLAQWYATLPQATLAAGSTQPNPDTVKIIFSEKDLARFHIPANLKAEFIALYQRRLPDSSKYITTRYKQYTLDHIRHLEEPYEQPAYPDEAHRLLALFRYWNIINYFYPHKLTATRHWPKVLDKYIPLFMQAGNEKEYRTTFLQLTTELKDSHSFFTQDEWDKARYAYDAPFRVYYAHGKYFIGESPYDSIMQAHNYQIGDEIIAINGKPIKKRVKELAAYTTGTNRLSYYRNIGNALFQLGLKEVQVTLLRGNTKIEKQVPLFSPDTQLYPYRVRHQPDLWKEVQPGIWHVNFCKITKADTLQQLFKDIRLARAVIWDMRAYPKFQVVQAVLPFLFKSQPLSAIDYNGVLAFPGVLAKNRGIPAVEGLEKNLPRYEGKMVVLVNEHTQSLAESFACTLRSRPNTIIMGRQTAGTTGNILWVNYPGGISASFTGVLVEGVDGNFQQGRGVKLDKKVKLSGKKVRSSQDYVLQKALQEIAKGVR